MVLLGLRLLVFVPEASLAFKRLNHRGQLPLVHDPCTVPDHQHGGVLIVHGAKTLQEFGGDEEILRLGSRSTAALHDAVEDQALVPLIHALVDLVHDSKRRRGEALQGHEEHDGRYGSLAAAVAVSGELGHLGVVSEADLHTKLVLVHLALAPKLHLNIHISVNFLVNFICNRSPRLCTARRSCSC